MPIESSSCLMSSNLGSALLCNNELNLSSIQMKILNDIACNLILIQIDWIECKFNSIEREMGCKLMYKVLRICLWLWCWKKYSQYIHPKRQMSILLYLKME
jgi:hypothetical protein